ncbi:oxygenase MpaB family protein [Actinomycetospora sp. C-140]
MRPHDPADGYFGPGSVTWRVLADPAAGPGGLSALFLQALHPLAMAGVSEHSDFDTAFWPRMQRTAEYVMTVTYAGRDDVDAAAARVRRAHEFVRGTDPVTGRPYAAGDADLLRWVHVTEVSSFLEAVRRAGAPISDAEADEYYREQVVAARLLGATDVPASRAEVADYVADVRRRDLRASPTSRAAALRLLVPPMSLRTTLTTPARPAWTAVAALGFALQPRWARRMHGVPVLPTTDLGATLTIRALRAAVLRLPEDWRHGPLAREALARERTAS